MGLRHAIAFALTVSAAASPSAQRIDVDAAVARARRYLAAWKPSLAAIVAEERYRQTLQQFPMDRDVVSGPIVTTNRDLLSDVLLVRAGEAWLMFRDVMTVDGVAVHDRRRRFDELFKTPGANLVTSARRIADEGARYNLGRLFRNLNTPTTALVYLEDAYASSVRWRDAKRVDLDGTPAIELAFHQNRAPYAIRSLNGEPQAARGRIWIESTSSRILRTELEIRGRVPVEGSAVRPNMPRSFVTVTARFGPVPGLEAWVPLSMEDAYEVEGRAEERMKGAALYTNHRIFQTSARIVGADR
jgi:hypothetical protein